jgi:hypothetical protein
VHDEWARCLNVAASLSRAPAVGEEAVLRVDIRADVARPGARITIELPANLSFAAPPPGATVTTGRSSSGVGAATRATTKADLTAGSVRHFAARIRATAAGPAHVRVRVVAEASWGTDAGSDDVFLTVGRSAGSSRIGFTTSTSGSVTRAIGTSAPSERHRRHKVVPLTGLPRPHSDDKPAAAPSATSCATGSWFFQDQNFALQPSINYQVQVWDDDTSSGDDLMGTGVTSFSGSYNVCGDGADGEGGGPEIYVLFISSNSLWRVRDTPGGNNNYVNQTGVQAVCDGCTANFGSLMPGNDIHRGMHAFDSANDFWVWVPSTCWDANDGTCRQLVINWTATSVDGTYYSLAGNDVHLAADDPNAPHVTIHEAGHAVMDDTYEDDFPPFPNCNPHSIQGASSTGCAWTEGFAEWVPASVLNDPFFRWPNGAFLNLETPTWGTLGWDSGDAVEGRVAGAMIDISDFTDEAYWDRYGEGDPGNQWTTFLNHVSDTFLLYWGHRAADGFNTANTGANGSVYQNTIDYTFRDPLGNYVELTRPTPTPHNYSYSTSSIYWSAVAIRPPSGVDYDLTLYDDVGQTVNLGGSAFGGSTIDFVTVDSNHRALGDYYPRAYQFNGTGIYQVELAQGSDQLNIGSQTVFMGTNDVILIRDSNQAGGVPTFFRVIPTNGGQDPELFLMQSDGANSATWVRSRGSAVASSTANGAGAAEGFSYTPPASDWYGLVLTNKVGSGNYTLHVDTSAPTGSVVINGGDAATNDPNVTLDLSGAADSQTGVEAMRISTDGVMDAEPFVPFAASAPATLAAGDGTKTVLAQFRNGAGMLSPVVSDTIVLDTTDPVAKKPVASIPLNATLGTADIPVKVTWSATDALTGVAAYELQESTNGGTSWSPVTLPTPTTTTMTFDLAPGSTQYRFRERATDGVGNRSSFATGPTFRVSLHQETSPPVTLTSQWLTVNDPNASGGAMVRAFQAGEMATFNTTSARHLAWVARKGPNAGIAEVYVDGVLEATVDLYSASIRNQRVVFSKKVSAGDPHEMVIKVTGTKNPASSAANIFLDAIARLN